MPLAVSSLMVSLIEHIEESMSVTQCSTTPLSCPEGFGFAGLTALTRPMTLGRLKLPKSSRAAMSLMNCRYQCRIRTISMPLVYEARLRYTCKSGQSLMPSSGRTVMRS